MTKSNASIAPRLVITGGNYHPNIAHIDWLAITVQLSESRNILWLVDSLRQFIPDIALQSTGSGWFGYEERFNIEHSDRRTDLGLIAAGGESQRGTASIQINAQGCALIEEWEAFMTWCIDNAKKITRVDLAHDDFKGENLNIEKALDWHSEGLFSQNGARQGKTAVKAKLIDDLESGDGKTFYVGRRSSGKLLRIYEKGKQLGDSSSNWTRAEVELKDKGRIIPWDVLINPSKYLAACYPCLGYLSEVQIKIKTISKSAKVTIASATHHLQLMGGKLINLLWLQHNQNADLVVSILRREGVPKRLEGYAAFLPDVLKGGEK